MNTSIRSKLFGRPVWDIIMEVYAENQLPYTTTLPSEGQSSKKRAPALPMLNKKNIIRGPQPKQAHRSQCAAIAAGPEHEFTTMKAALQTFQGGFIGKAVNTRMPDRDELQVRNPVVFLHGAGTIGGQMHFGHLIARNEASGDNQSFPVIRTDSTEQQLYIMSKEGSTELTNMKTIHRNRRPYTNAMDQIKRKGDRTEVMEALIAVLNDDNRGDAAGEVTQFMAKKPSDKNIDKWLSDKKKSYTNEMNKAGIPNVEIRQALPGYRIIEPNTGFDQRMAAWGVTDYHAGLMFKAFYRRIPILGGRAAVGCGAHLRQIIRVSVSDTVNAPSFDGLIKIEPFMPLAFCFDASVLLGPEIWENDALKWVSIEQAPNCFIRRAIEAWNTCDRSQFDFNFVPGGIVEDDGDNSEDEDA